MTALELEWELVTDRVMGGVSNGRIEQTVINGRTAIRMTGRVSLDNNGGFIQIAADLPRPPASATGIAPGSVLNNPVQFCLKENIRRIGIVAIGRVFDADAAEFSVSYY